MKTKFSLFSLVLFVFTVASVLWSTGVQAQTAAEKEIRTFVDQWETAYNKEDIDFIKNSFTTDAVQTQPDGTTLVGNDAIASRYNELFKTGDGKSDISVEDVSALGNDQYWIAGNYTVKVEPSSDASAASGAGTGVIDIKGHYAAVVQQTKKGWKIVRHMFDEEMTKPSDRN